MNVLWITTFPPRRCGIGDYASDLASTLSRVYHLDLRILTYPDGLAKGLATEGDFEVSRRLTPVFSLKRVASEIQSFGADVVHFQSSSFLHGPAVNREVASARHAPLVTTVHDAPDSWRIFYAIPGLRKVYRSSSRLFVHSTTAARVLALFHHVDQRKIVKVPLGVDLDKYTPGASPDEALTKYKIEGRRIVLFFGFVRPGKGLETLVEAWSRIQSSFKDSVLVIAGGLPSRAGRYDLLLRSETDYPNSIRKLAVRLGILNRVVFTEYVPESLVPGLLASSALVVLPYDRGTVQSGPLHRALASGRAVVTSDAPGFREVLANANCGILVPPRNPERLASAMQSLLEDPVKTRELGRRARTKALESLSWSAIAGKTFEVYESLIATESQQVNGGLPQA